MHYVSLCHYCIAWQLVIQSCFITVEYIMFIIHHEIRIAYKIHETKKMHHILHHVVYHILDLMQEPPGKKKGRKNNSSIIPSSGFPTGKLTNHLKQTQDIVSSSSSSPSSSSSSHEHHHHHHQHHHPQLKNSRRTRDILGDRTPCFNLAWAAL